MSGGIYGVGKYISFGYFDIWNLFLEDISPIVIDPGSHSIRAGYGGQEQPFVSHLYSGIHYIMVLYNV